MASSQVNQKKFLFYSNNCPHSKRLLHRLQQTSLLNTIQLINIDDPRVKLPQFLNSVPTLFLAAESKVLADAQLFQWVEQQLVASQKSQNLQNIAEITGDASILPFQMGEMGSGLTGSSYSFIEESQNDLMNQNYSFLQDRDINKMPEFTKYNPNAPTLGSSTGDGNMGAGTQTKKTGGTVDRAYEALMASRNSEMAGRNQIPPTPNFASPF